MKKGYKTSPSIRIPRKAAEKMQAAAAAAAAAAAEVITLRRALKDAVALIDELLEHGGKEAGWTRGDSKKIEMIRTLSQRVP